MGSELNLEAFDAGLLNDFGGGNTEWWLDYIRSLLGQAHEHYQTQADNWNTRAPDAKAETVAGKNALMDLCNQVVAALAGSEYQQAEIVRHDDSSSDITLRTREGYNTLQLPYEAGRLAGMEQAAVIADAEYNQQFRRMEDNRRAGNKVVAARCDEGCRIASRILAQIRAAKEGS